jgi:chromate reductase
MQPEGPEQTPARALKILLLCGSLQETSGNLRLLQTAIEQRPPGVEMQLFDGLRDLPLFNPDLERDGSVPAVDAFRAALRDSDALLIATPEYGFSLPGALKNAVDWVIGSGELERKVVATTAAVPGRERGRRGLRALAETLSAVRVRAVGGEPIARGPDFTAEVRALVSALVEAARAARAEEAG